jgi:hypothetical protein
MANQIRFLHIAYWWGIIADAVDVVLMLFPSLFVRFMNFDIEANRNFDIGMRFGVPLMAGWTILLFWADRDPVERKDILLLTLPVIAGYFIYWIYSIGADAVSLSSLIPVFILQSGLAFMIIFAWRNARSDSTEVIQ